MGEAWLVRLRYTHRALADLERLLDDIAAQSPRGAKRVQARLKAVIPSYGVSLIDDAELCQRVRAETAEVLHLRNV